MNSEAPSWGPITSTRCPIQCLHQLFHPDSHTSPFQVCKYQVWSHRRPSTASPTMGVPIRTKLSLTHYNHQRPPSTFHTYVTLWSTLFHGRPSTNIKLAEYPVTRDTYTTAFETEFINLVQGNDKTVTIRIDSIFILNKYQIKTIPADQVVTYSWVDINYIPQNEDLNIVQLTAGGGFISSPVKLATRTSDLDATNILWNVVISTNGARYVCVDIKIYILAHHSTDMNTRRFPLACSLSTPL